VAVSANLCYASQMVAARFSVSTHVDKATRTLTNYNMCIDINTGGNRSCRWI